MIDVNKQMTFEEVKNFFSATHEFSVEDLSSIDNPAPYLRVTFTEFAPMSLTKKVKCSILMSTIINVQQLIRTIHQLTYNMVTENYD